VKERRIDGVLVIAEQLARSSLPTPPGGSPVLFKQITELLLEDGQTLYGCVHCDFVGDSAPQVRPHLRVHRSGNAAPLAALNGMSVAELIGRAQAWERLASERDEWKDRAQKAEKQLGTLRNALKGLSPS